METAVRIVAPPDGRSQVSVNNTFRFWLTLIAVKDRLTTGGVKTNFTSSHLSPLYTALFVGGPRRTAIVFHPWLIKGHYQWLKSFFSVPSTLVLPLSVVFCTLIFLPSFLPFFCSLVWLSVAWSDAKCLLANYFTSFYALNCM